MKKVWLYAIDDMHRIVETAFLEGADISIRNMKNTAEWLSARIPKGLKIYAVDNRFGLFCEYRDAAIENNYTAQIEFEDMLETEGFRLK